MASAPHDTGAAVCAARDGQAALTVPELVEAESRALASVAFEDFLVFMTDPRSDTDISNVACDWTRTTDRFYARIEWTNRSNWTVTHKGPFCATPEQALRHVHAFCKCITTATDASLSLPRNRVAVAEEAAAAEQKAERARQEAEAARAAAAEKQARMAE